MNCGLAFNEKPGWGKKKKKKILTYKWIAKAIHNNIKITIRELKIRLSYEVVAVLRGFCYILIDSNWP